MRTDRRLVLVRHAKAAEGTADIDRPLADRGRTDAPAIGRLLRDLGIAPDRVVVSPAKRTRQTWKLAAAELDASPAAESDDRIYDNSIRQLLAIAQSTDEAVGTLVLVGHNPSMHELVETLDDGRGDPAVRARLADGFRTSAVAVFAVTEWPALTAGSARLVHLATPRG